ncbi:MAG: rhodanese-like domain-containing protein [Spirochaetales bacterium]|nr:rhodanese-like domain-containing protein [Spirochaetales bacterium]
MQEWLQYLLIFILVVVTAVIAGIYRVRRNREQQKNLSLNSTLQKLINQDQYEYYLIDVRSEAEFRKGHIPTAVNVPYGQLGSFLPTDKLFTNMVVYGRSPLQSNRAATVLSEAGYFNVTSFGPIFKWRGPVSRGKDEKDEKKTGSSPSSSPA